MFILIITADSLLSSPLLSCCLSRIVVLNIRYNGVRYFYIVLVLLTAAHLFLPYSFRPPLTNPPPFLFILDQSFWPPRLVPSSGFSLYIYITYHRMETFVSDTYSSLMLPPHFNRFTVQCSLLGLLTTSLLAPNLLSFFSSLFLRRLAALSYSSIDRKYQYQFFHLSTRLVSSICLVSSHPITSVGSCIHHTYIHNIHSGRKEGRPTEARSSSLISSSPHFLAAITTSRCCILTSSTSIHLVADSNHL